LFRWVTNSGQTDVDALIKKTYEKVEKNEWSKMDLDVSTVARDELADLFKEQLDQIKDTWAGNHGWSLDDWSITDLDHGSYYKEPESLFLPILTNALDNIMFEVVAQAILIRAGKWAPDKDRPEAI